MLRRQGPLGLTRGFLASMLDCWLFLHSKQLRCSLQACQCLASLGVYFLRRLFIPRRCVGVPGYQLLTRMRTPLNREIKTRLPIWLQAARFVSKKYNISISSTGCTCLIIAGCWPSEGRGLSHQWHFIMTNDTVCQVLRYLLSIHQWVACPSFKLHSGHWRPD